MRGILWEQDDSGNTGYDSSVSAQVSRFVKPKEIILWSFAPPFGSKAWSCPVNATVNVIEKTGVSRYSLQSIRQLYNGLLYQSRPYEYVEGGGHLSVKVMTST
jgi:hypothetical protein